MNKTRYKTNYIVHDNGEVFIRNQVETLMLKMNYHAGDYYR